MQVCLPSGEPISVELTANDGSRPGPRVGVAAEEETANWPDTDGPAGQ